MNAGSLANTPKPTDMTGMAMSGMIDSGSYDPSTKTFANNVSGVASYSGEGLQSKISSTRNDGLKDYGSNYVAQPWVETGGAFSVAEAGIYAGRQMIADPVTGQFTAKENFIQATADTSYGHSGHVTPYRNNESNDIVKAARANSDLATEKPEPKKE